MDPCVDLLKCFVRSIITFIYSFTLLILYRVADLRRCIMSYRVWSRLTLSRFGYTYFLWFYLLRVNDWVKQTLRYRWLILPFLLLPHMFLCSTNSSHWRKTIFLNLYVSKLVLVFLNSCGRNLVVSLPYASVFFYISVNVVVAACCSWWIVMTTL